MNNSKIATNIVYQICYQILMIILPIITSPYIARALGPEKNGIYVYTYTIASYFVLFSALGIDVYGNRTIANARVFGKQAIDKAFSELFFLHLIVSVIGTIAYCICLRLNMNQYFNIAALQILLLISNLIDINWAFFGIEEFKLTVNRNVIIKLFTVLAFFIFVKSPTDLWKYTLIMALGNLLSNAVLYLFAWKYFRLVKVKYRQVFAHLKPMLILFIAVIATTIYVMMDKAMLGWMGKLTELAAYEYADRMNRMILTVITAVSTVMLPRMSMLYASKEYDKINVYMEWSSRFVLYSSFALAFGLAGIARVFMPLLLGNGYDIAPKLVRILCVSLPVMGWNNLVCTQILIPREMDRVYTIAVWMGALVNIILNLILIKKFGAVGAAWATVIAYIVVGVFQTVPLVGSVKMGRLLRNMYIPVFSGTIMFIAVDFIGTLLKGDILTVVLQILGGAIVFISISFVMIWRFDPEIITQIKNYRNHRFDINGCE